MATNLFVDCFVREYVMVLTSLTTSSDQEDGQGGYFSVAKPLYILGYLIDVDKENLYLGDTTNLITKAIPKHNVVCVEITEELTDDDEVLSNFPVPTERSGVN